MNYKSPMMWLAVIGGILGVLALYAFVMMPTFVVPDPGTGAAAGNGAGAGTGAATVEGAAMPSQRGSRANYNSRVPSYSQRPAYQGLLRR